MNLLLHPYLYSSITLSPQPAVQFAFQVHLIRILLIYANLIFEQNIHQFHHYYSLLTSTLPNLNSFFTLLCLDITLGSNLSKLTKDKAALLCTYAVRYSGHLRVLQILCRKKFRRYLDDSVVPLSENKKNPSCYYYNSVYGTTSWIKPYCLRNTELKPLISEERAATKIQGLYKLFIARRETILKMNSCYSKIFDRMSGKYYYAFRGISKLVPSQKWKKPILCSRQGYKIIFDIPILYTIDISAIKIQDKWRSFLVRAKSK